MSYIKLDADGFVLDVVRNRPAEGVFQELTIEELKCIATSPRGHIDFTYKQGVLNYARVPDPEVIHDESVATVERLNDVSSAEKITTLHPEALEQEMGYFGNVWIIKLFFKKAGVIHEGHTHDHDHVSLLLSGSVEVKVEGHEPQIFKAPTYVTIRAHLNHEIIALEDDTLWWCIHARRDEAGEVVELYEKTNDPLGKGV